jgi:hypothetical protein
MCFRPRRRHGCVGAAAGKPAACMEALGDGGATWRSAERASAGWGAAARVLG